MISSWWWTYVPPKRRFLQKPHSVTSQRTAFFEIIVNSMLVNITANFFKLTQDVKQTNDASILSWNYRAAENEGAWMRGTYSRTRTVGQNNKKRNDPWRKKIKKCVGSFLYDLVWEHTFLVQKLSTHVARTTYRLLLRTGFSYRRLHHKLTNRFGHQHSKLFVSV
jgi:hypothetical protein